MRHKVNIKVAKNEMESEMVLASKSKRISSRIARFLFGDYSEVLILSPGKTVKAVEIHEINEEVNHAG